MTAASVHTFENIAGLTHVGSLPGIVQNVIESKDQAREEAEQHPDVEISHIHLNDKTVAGLRIKNKKCFSVQYHPEASPGPNDSKYLFSNFVENIKTHNLNQ